MSNSKVDRRLSFSDEEKLNTIIGDVVSNPLVTKMLLRDADSLLGLNFYKERNPSIYRALVELQNFVKDQELAHFRLGFTNFLNR